MERLEDRALLSVTVERTSLNLRFSIDDANPDRPDSEYQTFAVTNDELGTLSNVWVQAIVADPTQSVQLAPNEDGLYFLGDLTPGETDTAFIYFYGQTVTAVPDPQPFDIKVWKNGPPGTGTEVPVTFTQPADTEFEWVAAATGDNDGSVTETVTTTYAYAGNPSPVPVVGGTMTMVVTGRIKNNADRVLYSPATNHDWPADTFVLDAVKVTYPGSTPDSLPDDSLFEKPIVGSPKDFIATYTFRIEGTTAAATPVTAREWTAAGAIGNRKFDHSRLIGTEVPIPPAVYNTALEITKSGTTIAVAGSTSIYSYTITVTSTGISNSTGVVVTDTWPAGFTKQTISPPAGTTITNETTTGFKWNIGTLAAGTSKTLIVSFKVPKTTAAGPYTNTAIVTSTSPNPNPTSATATTTVVDVPLTITKSPDETVVAGAAAVQSYSIVVTNVSAYAAEGVSVADAWPAAFNRMTITPPPGTSITTTSTGFTWTIGPMTAGQSSTLTVSYTVPKATAVGVYTNTATLSSTTADPGPTVAQATTTVVAVDLTITKSGPTTLYREDSSQYAITVTNTSSLFKAENVTVTDIWPVGFTQGTFSGPGTIAPFGGGDFLWTIGDIDPLASVTLLVTFAVPAGAALKLYSNDATVSSDTQDPGPKTVQVDTLVIARNISAGVVVCTDDGCAPAWVRVLDRDGNVLGEFQPYPGVRGGLRVTAADVNGDGVEEIIVGPGLGVAKPVRVLTTTGGAVAGFPDFYPFGTKWRNGVEVAAADINNDGREDVITGMSLGVGTVNVYITNTGLSLFRSFRGSPTGYAGGVRLASADFGTYSDGVLVNPSLDGKAEVVVGTNSGITAQARIFDVQPTVPKLARTILPFGTAFTGGVSLSTGNYDGDAAGVPELLVGAGIGGQSVVKVFNVQTGSLIPGGTLTYFSSPTFAKPNAVVNVAPLDLDGDQTIDTLYGVQGRGGAGGTTGLRKVVLASPTPIPLRNYPPPMRIAPINLALNGAQSRPLTVRPH